MNARVPEPFVSIPRPVIPDMKSKEKKERRKKIEAGDEKKEIHRQGKDAEWSGREVNGRSNHG